MKLNKSKGNMYEFVTFTGNVIKGKCPYDCTYCYCKKWGKQSELHFDEKELAKEMNYAGVGMAAETIFVGSSCDMWADDIPDEWIKRVLNHCSSYLATFLFQSKNPMRFIELLELKEFTFPKYRMFCTTIESNIDYPQISKAPKIIERANAMKLLKERGEKVMVTIEPVLDFDVDLFSFLIDKINPDFLNIGADSGNNKLPEPSKEKLETLLSRFDFHQKKNLKRLLK